MSDTNADTVIILSSELIAAITEEYFNKTMFKQEVRIVDLKPTETGYLFSIAFVSEKENYKQTPQFTNTMQHTQFPTTERQSTALQPRRSVQNHSSAHSARTVPQTDSRDEWDENS
jgi:mannitol-1-phosphate/altronate dehydrogenase